ncbi:MAG: DNA polymerase III subunit delta [Candidatus Magasanikbacteria bacterium CG11_big_fil_rev_8_21_14_0_20_39_34]|uniref:DNA polymerase III subunit delta n=1 Tax=Candidatus Magasanikbacteria bacterium CG11_big_fil_rev_8_21_14_0_20_39_34 TaxID=1974653 RepID=A0A2H0N6K6_9BACT|nr:MAG: DNA polymerase III subunit delta [Candidatus Magasanikbacteria bacterium CG11_big_fil_rev_8_21_14_0_20_39_34]
MKTIAKTELECYYTHKMDIMIIFLYGQDTLRSKRRLGEMTEKFKQDRDPSGINIVSLDCQKEKNFSNVLEQIFASPFLAEKRLIIIENLLASPHTELQKKILSHIESQEIPDSNILLFCEESDTFKGKEAKKLFLRLTEEKFSQKFDALKGAQLLGWVDLEIKERGGQIEKPALLYLVENTQNDTWKISHLIDQLIAFTAGKTIKKEDVKKFVTENFDDNIFNLIDAIVKKQLSTVFQMIEQQYKISKDASYIFSMLLRQYKILLQLKDLENRGENLKNPLIAQKLSLHPFVVKKTLPMLSHYTFKELSTIHKNLLDLDIKIKTGQADPKILLDVFIGSITLSENLHNTPQK